MGKIQGEQIMEKLSSRQGKVIFLFKGQGGPRTKQGGLGVLRPAGPAHVVQESEVGSGILS